MQRRRVVRLIAAVSLGILLGLGAFSSDSELFGPKITLADPGGGSGGNGGSSRP